MNVRNVLISMIFILVFAPLKAQDTLFVDPDKLDSLKVLVFKRNHNDKERIRLLNEYARMSFYNQEIIQGFTATIEAIELSEEIEYKEGEIMFHETLAAFLGPGDIVSYHHQKARMLSTQLNQNDSFSEVQLPDGYPTPYNEISYKKLLKASEHFKDVENKEVLAVIYDHLGYYYYTINNIDQFRITANSIIAIYSDLEEFYPIFLYYSYLGYVAVEENDVAEKEIIQAKIKELVASMKNKTETGPLNFQLANYYRINGQNTIAIEHYLLCIDFFESINDYFMLTDVYSQMYRLYSDLEMFDRGAEAMENRVKLLETHNLSSDMFNAYNQVMWAMYDAKNYEKARYYNELKKSTSTPLTAEEFVADSYSLEGHIQMDNKHYRAAISLIEKALDVSMRLNRVDNDEWEAYRIATCYYNLNEHEKALEYALLSQEVLHEDNVRLKKRLNMTLSDIYDALGNEKLAYKHLRVYKDLIIESEDIDIANVLMKAEVRSVIESNQMEIDSLEREQFIKEQENKNQRLWIISIAGALLFALILSFILFRNNKNRQKANSILVQQKEKVQETLEELKVTQSQLVQSEKMASLGELTAGIAHEIQNPLNFVNNFSEVSQELMKEMQDEIKKGDKEEALEIGNDIEQNLEKIHHHGQRASEIVKGMLQHSRSSTGIRELTDINTLTDEYLRLAYHGLRAKDKSFNAKLETNFDEQLKKINIIPQEMGRVILNLITNAFYAVNEKNALHPENYEPKVTVSTEKTRNGAVITIKDNGNGIPQEVLDKIFQPFFTTKPAGQGTGLGLSLSYDIVKAHGGDLKVETEQGTGTVFSIMLPV
ncbi:ATP-binding protein [Lutimonas halocynthiae]|uniref:ATP-binding protein n=1 Tax=Lutimonas halocynthiae TaxID=1446477 RepID=UPI0025B41318|nr:ATP-binding protein [Lutimonas halocynthiae]MDN3642877.1 ATP-binding protein [Lutimonas halocynthiae]